MIEKNPNGPFTNSSPTETFSQDDLIEEFRDLNESSLEHLEASGLEGSLEKLSRLESVFQTIEDDLAKIDGEYAVNTQANPDKRDSVELASAILALEVVRRFIESPSLNRLYNGLLDLANGSSPAGMFLPAKTKSRRPDSANIQRAKGAIAAIIYAKQKIGKLGREEAAKWVLNNLSPNLRGRLYQKPISTRTLIDWLDRYGGKTGERGHGRDKFVECSMHFLNWPDLREDDCASFTGGLAKELPTLSRAKHSKPPS
jgi:hypothetical protein